MLQKIAINSKSTGKFREETINARPHIVTSMVSIEGDSIMNRLFYPANEVISASNQLNRIPAPVSHPQVDGLFISAKDPMAMNAHSVGGFVMNPKVNGKQIINDLVFDLEVAEKDDRGKEIVRRIKAGERIGVSTGLNAQVVNIAGKQGDKEYQGIISNIEFDHVAVLLDEAPAGDSTFTINSGAQRDVLVCNLAESVDELERKVREAVDIKFQAQNKHAWVFRILFSPDRAVVEIHKEGKAEKLILIPFGYNDAGDVVFTGEGIEVERKESFEPVGNPAGINNHQQEVDDMDKEKLVLSIIGNSSNAFAGEDKDHLMSLSETQLINAVSEKTYVPITVEKATQVLEKEGLTVNAKDFDKEGLKTFLENKSDFEAFLAGKTEKRGKMIEDIVTNSKMSKEDLEHFDDEALLRMATSFTPNQDYSAQASITTNASKESVEVDYS